MTRKHSITAYFVRKIFDYDPKTGILIWKHRPPDTFKATEKRSALHISKVWNSQWVGKAAGTPNPDGYLVVTINSIGVSAAHVIWLYMVGEWPAGEIDHRDRIRTNNRWGNLRAASRSQNCSNTERKTTNTSGFKNVSWDSDASKWRARMSVDGKREMLGRFNTAEEAHRAYVAAAKKYLGEFANTG